MENKTINSNLKSYISRKLENIQFDPENLKLREFDHPLYPSMHWSVEMFDILKLFLSFLNEIEAKIEALEKDKEQKEKEQKESENRWKHLWLQATLRNVEKEPCSFCKKEGAKAKLPFLSPFVDKFFFSCDKCWNSHLFARNFDGVQKFMESLN